jgi:hypothetical protein
VELVGELADVAVMGVMVRLCLERGELFEESGRGETARGVEGLVAKVCSASGVFVGEDTPGQPCLVEGALPTTVIRVVGECLVEAVDGLVPMLGIGESESAVDPSGCGVQGDVVKQAGELGKLVFLSGVSVLVLGAAQRGHGLTGVAEVCVRDSLVS